MPLAPRSAFPFQITRQPGLTPRERLPPGSVQGRGAPFVNFPNLLFERAQIFQDDAALNTDVRLARLVVVVTVIAVNGARVDAPVQRQHGHATLVAVARGQSPEATVRVPVFGTDA